jgi:hypothetical protein
MDQNKVKAIGHAMIDAVEPFKTDEGAVPPEAVDASLHVFVTAITGMYAPACDGKARQELRDMLRREAIHWIFEQRNRQGV